MSHCRKNDNELCRALASASTVLPRDPKVISGNSSKIALAVARSSKGTGEAGDASVGALERAFAGPTSVFTKYAGRHDAPKQFLCKFVMPKIICSIWEL